MKASEIIEAMEGLPPDTEVFISNGTFQSKQSIRSVIVADDEGRVATMLQGHQVKYNTGTPGRAFLVEGR